MRSRKQTSLGKKIIIWIIGILVLLAITIGFMGYRYFKQALKPLDSKDDTVSQIHVPMGASNKQIGSILERKGIVKSGVVFDYYVKSSNLTGFRAGYYQLKPSMSLKTISKKLQAGGSDQPIQSSSGKLLVREGANIDQIAKEISHTTDFSAASFKKLVNDKTYLAKLEKMYPELLTSAMEAKNVRYRLEGYLYPATYEVKKDTSLQQLVTQMVAQTNLILKPDYAKIKKAKMSVQEMMTLASLIEREGVDQTDRRKMAGALENRIDIDMPLQSDVAVLYAIHRNNKELTVKDLKVDSPYNLYVHPGYGPGPFDSPSKSAIDAVLNPLDRSKKYLYFVANTKTKKVYYAKTFDQHQANIAKYAKDN